jgi:integrase
MGLGPLDLVSLREAREKCFSFRRLLFDGFDPIEVRIKNDRAKIENEQRNISFDECAQQYIASKRSEWKNEKHIAQWSSTLSKHANPIIGSLPVQAIDTALVLQILQPIWLEKPETASRIRGRIESVLAYASARGWRDANNPAAWRGHLNAILPMPTKVKAIRHMPALPWKDIPAFMSALRAKNSLTARAVELQVLTALRPGELVAAHFAEFDLVCRVWTVPAKRMKMGKAHRIPLTDRMVEIVTHLTPHGNFLFPGIRTDHLCTNGLLKLVKEMRTDIEVTSHGFRSTFKDWATETTSYSREVIEMCLAHSIGDKVEAAYRRGDLFEKRRLLMHEWNLYCLGRDNQTTKPASFSSLGV